MSTSAPNGNATTVFEACRGRLGRVLIQDMAQATGLTQDQVSVAFGVLIDRGYARRALRGVYRLTQEGIEALEKPICIKSGPNGPRILDLPHTSVRTRIWRALRITHKGSISDLLVLASKGEEISPTDIKSYLNALAASGYLTRLSIKGERNTTRYLLIRDTGPKAPQWNKRKKRILDANTGEIHELA